MENNKNQMPMDRKPEKYSYRAGTLLVIRFNVTILVTYIY